MMFDDRKRNKITLEPEGSIEMPAFAGMYEPVFRAVSLEPTRRGKIAMALDVKGQRLCKIVHTENGRIWTRRIHTMMVQAADGRLHRLEGRDLPDSISLYTGAPYSGAHAADVLLNPKDATGSLMLPPSSSGWLSKRDAFFLCLGMFVFSLIFFLSENAAIALS